METGFGKGYGDVKENFPGGTKRHTLKYSLKFDDNDYI